MAKITGKLHTFTINYVSELSGDEYSGQFTCRKQSILDFSKINRRKGELSGGAYCVVDDDGKPTGQGIDQETEYTNMVIATLEQMLVQKPDWWDLGILDDYGLLSCVYKEVQKFESSFRRRTGTPVEEPTGHIPGSEGTGEAERKTANNSDNAPKVVDRKVQAALDA